MINTELVNEEIIIRPSELDKVHDTIVKKINEKIGTCSLEKGYIVGVENIYRHILQNKISRNSGNCIFNVSYNIQTLKPTKGHVYEATIVNIFKEGIFCEYKNIKILIPISELKEYEFCQFIPSFTCKDKNLKIGDKITVVIFAVRYENKNYKCIAKLN